MKNFLRLTMILFVVSMVSFASCTKDETPDPTPTPTPTGFTFAAVGHQWIMNNDSAGVTQPNDTMKIIAKLANNKWMFNDSSLFHCSSSEFGFMADTALIILCKIDAKVNDEYNSDMGMGLILNAKVISINESVIVPAGTFTCFKIEVGFMGQVFGTYYINKNYGFIKITDSEGFTSKLASKNF